MMVPYKKGGDGGKDEGEGSNIRYLLNCVIIGIIALVVLILFTILIIFLVLRPTKPKFWLQDVTVYNLTLSKDQGHYLTTTMQVTLSSSNPNQRIGVSYDKLDVFVEYRQQQVTIPTAINNVYQGKKDVNVWSPFLYGVDVPVAEYMCVDMAHDKIAGLVLVHIRVAGRVRWKVGTWMSGHYHIRVTCPAFLTVRENDPHSDTNGDSFKFQQITRCNVDV